MNTLSPGKILLAEPFMRDPYFNRAVVFLCEHHNKGSVGFILNKEIDIPLNDLLASFPPFEEPVYYGGPVQTDTLHYVHRIGHLLDDSIEITDGVFWGGDYEKLKALVRNGLVNANDIRFFVGYSGWSGGQLNEEMDIGSWVTADMHANYIFKSNPSKLWAQVMTNKGDNFGVIAKMPDHLSMN